MIRKYFLLPVLFLTFTLVTSCGAIIKLKGNKYLTEERGAIPPEFGNANNILLFITHHRSYNRYLKRNVKKKFTGTYEFVSEKEFTTNDKYKDIDTYRFIFDYSYRPVGYNHAKERNYLYSVKRFSILDRKTQKIYKSRITSSFWSKLQKVYLKKLNEKMIQQQTLN
ncbi:hypothetical protein ACFSTE_17795 [Aquimarina hainanensis]|uniref:Lipoprotein n=1 Tax=Aquimarina hainanensis TaxID=1578017 RepID=A0ABW5NCV4_9FLAO|nr:hypothetical protein [Aquimarina sp. TRL1]QKX06809.1 hypothetical protein HN014_18440 [Aquimarina sp. TRL1]